MKTFLLFTAIVFISTACFSQDIISLKQGRRIEVIITEVTPSLIRYRLYAEPQGKVYFTYKDDVSGIMYHDGRVETFEQSGKKDAGELQKTGNQQSVTSYENRKNVETPNHSINNSHQTSDFIQ